MTPRPILRLTRRLTQRPDPPPPLPPGGAVRNFRGADDIGPWLTLRTAALAEERPTPGPWTEADFQREFLAQPWWRAEQMWLAEQAGDAHAPAALVGSVTLAMRRGPAGETPIVHWLLVRPEFRRQGWGRGLMAALETACWEAGQTRIELETHSGWRAAGAFYAALGYEVDDA